MTSQCEQLDAFFDGELPAEAAAQFRDHLATCTRCQELLHGRMLEAMVIDEPVVPVRALPVRRARAAYVGIAMVLAASVALIWWLRGGKAAHHESLEIAMAVDRGSATMRGDSAHVGDVVHVRASAAIWIYRGDHELVLACPGGATCHDGGADLSPRAIGTYSIVTISTDVAVPAPHGNLDDDLSAAVHAGARYKIKTLDVQ